MSGRLHDELVLAIYPNSRDIAYTLFAAPLTPIDWGLKRIRGQKDRNARSLEMVNALITALRPDTIVIEDCETEECDRSDRIRRLYALIANLAESENLSLARYSKRRVKETFREAGTITRHEIALAIATHVPALSHRMPGMRKLWQSEDHRLAIFDAAALALTHYAVVPGEDAEPP
jgi:Holliday junction resolvasome RuvABC endonuclease subunit